MGYQDIGAWMDPVLRSKDRFLAFRLRILLKLLENPDEPYEDELKETLDRMEEDNE